MTQNNKKNRPANAAKPPVPSTEGAEASVQETPKAPVQQRSAPDAAPADPVETEVAEVEHDLAPNLAEFVESCEAYVDCLGSSKAQVVGNYRLTFHGPQLISVTHV